MGKAGFDSLLDCCSPRDIASWIRVEFTPHLRVAGGFFVVLPQHPRGTQASEGHKGIFPWDLLSICGL